MRGIYRAKGFSRVSRPTKVPAYRRHQQSGRAVVTLTGIGGRRDIYLGKYGSPESHSQYARVISEWTGTVSGFRQRDQPCSGEGLSINTLILKFWGHVERYYTKNGRPTSEQHNYKGALKPLRLLYGTTSATEFTPICLKALREHYVSQGLCRNEVNRRVRLVRSMFRWGVSEGLLHVSVWEALRSVPGLRKGIWIALLTPPAFPQPRLKPIGMPSDLKNASLPSGHPTFTAITRSASDVAAAVPGKPTRH